MSKSIQALRERKNELARQANELLANNGDRTWSKDDQAKYDGIMDEQMIFKKELDPEQIQEMYSIGKTRKKD